MAAVAEVADGRVELQRTAQRVCELVVPGFADACLVDVVHDDGLRRLAVKVADSGDLEARLAARPMPTGKEPGVGAAVALRKTQLLTAFPEEVLQAIAKDESDLDLLRGLRGNACIVIPLTARGRTLGALTFVMTEHSGRSYTSSDVAFFEVFAGRVALALDNAGLSLELQTMEAQLSVALDGLSEAVTIQNRRGDLIYANQTAAQMMGARTASELLAQPATALVSRYEYFHQDGTALDPRQFPGRQLLAGGTPEPLVMRVVDRSTGEQAWRMVKASAVHDSTGQLTMAVNVIADITAVKRAEIAQRVLAQAGELFGSSLELTDRLQQLADLCVPNLADWCTVRIADEHGRHLESVAVAHHDPERLGLVLATRERYAVALDDPGGLAEVFRSGNARCVNRVTDDMLVAMAKDPEHLQVMRELNPSATLILPLTTRGNTVGVLTLVSADSRRRFEDHDIELAAELARRAAAAVDNARLYTERSRIARVLQDSLLPDPLPTLPGWATASLYRPAGDQDRVGGDFFEAIPLGEQSWLLLVGDVTGRGAQAASLTAMMRHTLRTIATYTGSAFTALDKLNRDLVARPRMSLCTAVCVVLRERDDNPEADIICAGHPRPVLVREGCAQYVGEHGPLLGAYPDERFVRHTLAIQPGDILVLYSDGVLDTVGAEGRFESERLQSTLAAATGAADAVQRIDHALTTFQVGAQHDDTAVLAIERVRVPAGAAAGTPQSVGRDAAPDA